MITQVIKVTCKHSLDFDNEGNVLKLAFEIALAEVCLGQ